ncbi:hypothetical protein [Leptospira brenneri]|uniref:Lipoprotein n=1 Tax=Leptospira brenneri TaxID=2023182 RepID=A0A2M9XX41_9LEPT|nr:hypothetical protein [Leptospira brenneri]PJZ43905.1 hypothetical protein CH361_18040 [Leptospira brenneri]TGK93010.1 hypothetical protein EHQ30_12340 [Leptospira brenneri]
MKKITLVFAFAVSALVFHCQSGAKAGAEEGKTILEGNWVLTSNCVTNPSPNPTAWLIISNNRDIKSCYKKTSSVVKGQITGKDGNYHINWEVGPASTAQYPVGGPLNLFGMTTIENGQSYTVCYTRTKTVPAFCK